MIWVPSVATCVAHSRWLTPCNLICCAQFAQYIYIYIFSTSAGTHDQREIAAGTRTFEFLANHQIKFHREMAVKVRPRCLATGVLRV